MGGRYRISTNPASVASLRRYPTQIDPSVTRFVVTALSALAILTPTLATSQTYPSRPVRIIVGFAPGGTPDVFARLIAQKMSESWGQVIVENRQGATGNLAAEYVARSAPDGHTVFYSDSANFAINPHLFAKLPFDPLKDFAPVILTSILPTYVTVHPSVPVNTLAEFIAYAKERPGKLSYASVGSGSIHHITTELFKSVTGTDILHVPYKGAGPGGQALLAGEVQVAFLSYISVAQHVKAGKVKILAISMPQRSEALPDVPTMHEAGVPGFEMYSSLGVLAPAGTPREVIAKLNAGVAAALANPDIAARMTGFGVRTIQGGTPEQFGTVMRTEYEKFRNLVKLSGAKLE